MAPGSTFKKAKLDYVIRVEIKPELLSWARERAGYDLDALEHRFDKPDPEIDRVWAEEARKRWAAYKAGHIPTVSYEEVMAKH